MKNLCNYAVAGRDAVLESDVALVLRAFLGKKPVAALCIAPVLLGLALRGTGKAATLTLGDPERSPEVVADLTAWGCDVVGCAQGLAVVDPGLGCVTGPAFLYEESGPADIFRGAVALVDGLCHLVAS